MIQVYGTPVNVTVHRTVFPKNCLNFNIEGTKVSVTDLSGEFEHINGDLSEFIDGDGNGFADAAELSAYLDQVFHA